MNLQKLYFVFSIFIFICCVVVDSFVSRHLLSATSLVDSKTGRQRGLSVYAISDDDEEEIFIYDQQSRFLSSAAQNNTNQANYLDDLTPPPINIARNSILFSENPATKRNNAVLQSWKLCRKFLPPVFTGAWPWRDMSISERNPLGALYNMVLVRVPTIGITLIYVNNLWEGHPLIMDIGQGAFEMSPVVVFSVLALILA